MDPIAIFASPPASGAAMPLDRLFIPAWGREQWELVLAHATPRSLAASEVLIESGRRDRALHFVVAGELDVGITYVDGLSMSAVAKIGAGSVVGEQSFFDAHPRSANVWAMSEGRVLTLPFETFERFAATEPALARDLLFALGRVLSLRLRNTTVRVRR